MVTQSRLMVSVAGVRGIVGDTMTAEVALRWSRAFGHMNKPGPVIVGGDSRISKTMMRAATIAGLAEAGCRIIDVGVVPTPTIQLAVEYHHARGGIAITASHNPLEWNALKFFDSSALFLDEEYGARLKALAESDTYLGVHAAEIGSYERDEHSVERHADAVLKIPFLNRDKIAARKFKVGLDAVNGAGGELLRALCDKLGCEIVPFNLEPTGLFPRNPEPTTENLRAVGIAMAGSKVDIGFVVDPDADRLAIILENGTPAGEEYTLAAAVDTVLKNQSGPVVVNCSTSRAVHEIAVKYGSPVTETKVGEAHVSRGIVANDAIIGGEGNGGVMFPAVHNARDSAVGIALILYALAEHGGTTSEYFGSLPAYVIVKHRREFSSLEKQQAALASLHSFAAFGKANTLDGFKWSVDDGWVQVRASNTEPILRIFAEARTADSANRLAEQVMHFIDATTT